MAERKLTGQERQLVEERARGCWEYCRSQVRFAMQPFSVEHIEPRSREGPTVLDNLAFSCQGCNNHKYTKTEGFDPVTGQVVPLFHPRRQRWADHFRWSDDCTQVIGTTPIGRATVETMHLNRPGVVNLRRVLFLAGEHPPAEPASPEAPALPEDQS
jgi:5-methylcytosine-specific restriction endonuclease McrA